MAQGFNFDAVLEAVATAVAEKLRAQPGTAAVTVQPRLLSVDQAGQYLNRSSHSVRHLISAGKLPVVKLDNRIFLDIRDLDRVIEESKEVAL